MKRPQISPKSQYLKGFSLIELMISLTIGLIITVAVFSAYIGASGASRMAEAQGRMNEDAQAALIILSQQLRMAGNNPDQASRVDDVDPTLANSVRSSRHNPVYLPTPTYAGFALSPAAATLSSYRIRGCDGTFSNITTSTNLDNLTCAAGTTDSIAVSYEADIFNTLPAGGIPTDCLGQGLSQITATLPTLVGGATVNANVTYYVAENRFYIDTSASIPSLYCKGNGGATQPLVENIENMQFLYGATNSATNVTPMVAGYLNADGVIALSGNNPQNWKKVLTVRICVLVRSEIPVVSDAASARYIKCDGTQETAPPDLRLRRAYSTTVVLRNPQL
ncbi:MAG: prepilin-type N-terminal cleavage/methylation domain-containing protein [Glaciimonas sp.]|nr:prepilin-type N-terminal cleavage/methylation domain-containing protein [Glaciimonas sp.]